jgi:hypothetical protein
METIEKINVSKIKEDIKVLANGQKELKNQRKTEKLVGERYMSPSDATYDHQVNREKLRVMYAAYGLARGKKFSQIENHYPEENHPLNEYQNRIDKLLDGYKVKVEVDV